MISNVDSKPDGAPEWMVSFADMITIMMSFFVIMFAIASGEAAKGKRNRQLEATLNSLQARFGPTFQPFASWGVAPGNSPVRNAGAQQKGKDHPEVHEEETGPAKVRNDERARIRIPGRGDRVVIGGVVSFNAASVNLPKKQKQWLGVIAEELAGKPQQIEVVGYMSPKPLPQGSPYRDRYDLAYARCREVSQLLAGMDIERRRIAIKVVQAADSQPTADASQETPQDERVDIYLTDTIADTFNRGGRAYSE